MAVEGTWDGKPVKLDNAAEEATLRALLAAVERSNPNKAGSKSPLGTLSQSAKKADDALDGLLKSATHGSDNLDALAKESDDATQGLKKFGSSLAEGLGKILTGGKVDDIAAALFNPVSDALGGLRNAALLAALPTAGASLGLATLAQGAQLLVDGISLLSGAVIGATRGFSEQFQELASAGLVAGEGVGTFTHKVLDSGLTLGQYTKLMQENGDSIRAFGGSATQGTKQFLNYRKALKGNEEELLRYGYNYEEMNSLLVDYAGQMSLGFTKLNMSSAEVATRTTSYAKSLRIVSDLTGENAKTLKENSRQLMTNRLNQGVLADLTKQFGPGVMKSFGDISTGITKTLGPEFLTLFQQYMGPFGQATDAQTALLEQQNPILAEQLKSFSVSLKSGSVNADTALEDTVASIANLSKDPRVRDQLIATLKMSALGEMGAKGLETFGASLGETILKLGDISKIDMAVVKGNVDNAKTTTDEVTASIVGLNQAQQKLSMIQQDIATTMVTLLGPTTTTALNGFVDAVEWATSKIRLDTSPEAATRTSAEATARQTMMAPALSGLSSKVSEAGGLLSSGGIGASDPYRNFNNDELAAFGIKRKMGVKGMLGYERISLNSAVNARAAGMSQGGPVARGSDYLVGEGGKPEIFQPSTDGRIIPTGSAVPVKMSEIAVFRDMASKLDLLTRINGAMLTAMESNNRLTRQGNMLAG